MTHRNLAVWMGVLAAAVVALLLRPSVAPAATAACTGSVQSIQDDFTQANDQNCWKTFNGACLTAGDGTGAIPACVGLPYYQGQTLWGGNSGQLPDPAGFGALRFTNGNNTGPTGVFSNGYNQAGSIISNFTFPTGSGIQIVFKTVTYRGDSGGGSVHDGADGMSFFLMDGSYQPYDTGAFGGSLGYTCSNVNNDPTLRADGTPRQYDGLRGGYIGLGIDEYGNFLNAGDNTVTGYGYQGGRIGLRAAGSISWAALNALNSTYYPSSLTRSQQAAAVQNTCKTGVLWNYSNAANPRQTTTTVPDYAAIANGYTVLSGLKIANESANTRGAANPITYNLKITQDGLLSLSYSTGGAYQPIISKVNITDPAVNGPLPASFRFGFAGSDGGSTNVHEILCFQAQPAELAGTSVGLDAVQSAKVTTTTQAFLAYYYPGNWTGRLTASYLTFDGVNAGISAVANWDAACDLTGVAAGKTCPTTGAAGPISAQAPTNRQILTWSGSAGIPFEWSSLSTTQQQALDFADSTPINGNRLAYLRGDRSNEINASGVGLFRARDSVLADIVDSSPTWVGGPNLPYANAWRDLIHASATVPESSGSQTYAQYAKGPAKTRLNVVYAGANDGLLHGFRAGSFDNTGQFVTTYNDGQEVLAYMPGYILANTIHPQMANSAPPPATVLNTASDYSNSNYGHSFYVDATPDQDDLFYATTAVGCTSGCWHTWLVGGLGPGGPAIYALDVTDPSTFSETNAASNVIGEWTAANISCSNVSNCGANLGNTYGTPVIRRLHNGTWAVIFGNGFGSSSGDAGIFVMTVNPATTAKTFYYLSTGRAGSNGIAYVAPMDLDGDHITDYVYAGDLLGNVWRFDLTSTSPSSWAAGSAPLFTVNPAQPITIKPLVLIVPQQSGLPRVMVEFGTGRKFPLTNTTPQSYVTGQQYLYGIWDWNMGGWNSQAVGTAQMASLTAPQSISNSSLTLQTFSSVSAFERTDTVNVVCWAGTSICTGGASANNQFGWRLALPAANEQVVYNPSLQNGAFVVNSTIPASNSPLNCQVNIDTGWTIAVDPGSGGLDPTFFKYYPNDAAFYTSGTGTAFGFSIGGKDFVLTETQGNAATNVAPICPPGSPYCSAEIGPGPVSGKRLTWIQRR